MYTNVTTSLAGHLCTVPCTMGVLALLYANQESGGRLDARAHPKQSGQLMPGKADRDGNTPLDLVSLPLRKNLHATDENSRRVA